MQLKPCWRSDLERDWTGNPVQGYLNICYAMSEHYTMTSDTSLYLVTGILAFIWCPVGRVLLGNCLGMS